MASVDFSRENLSSLLKDGISEDLFKLLWARDELNYGPSINIPDTIIYKYGQPVSWYFTSVNGRIKRKNKHNLLSAKIEEAFNKYILGYDVVAFFINMPSEKETTPTVIEYFDRDSLNSFLYNHKKTANGILQRFIEPKSTHNELIRAVWSPKLCLLERAENIHQLHDHRYGLYERCVVYEGPDYYFTSAPLRGPVLSGQIQRLCESVVTHISEVTYGQKQVTRMVFNFKVDSRDKIWLLYTTSIRCVDMLELPIAGVEVERNLVNIDSVVTLPDKVHLNPNKTYEKIIPKTKSSCLSCDCITLDELRHPVTYKAISKHHDHLLYLIKSSNKQQSHMSMSGSIKDLAIPWPPDVEIINAAGGVGFGCIQHNEPSDGKTNKKGHHYHENGGNTFHIKTKTWKDVQIPPIITHLHPKLTVDVYNRCKDDPIFQNKTVHLCESCYLTYAEFTSMMLRLGPNMTKLLNPTGSNLTTRLGSTFTSFDRPSSADWRAISSQMLQNRSLSADSLEAKRAALSQTALRHQRDAKERAIGIRGNEVHTQPEVPSTIRTANESQHFASQVFGNQQHNHNVSTISGIQENSFMTTGMDSNYPGLMTMGSNAHQSPFHGGLLDFGSQSLASAVGYDANEVQQMIADRERKFFKEISLNPQLKDQHPLMHLITAQQKLKLVDQQSGVLMSAAATRQENVFGTRYGKQSQDKYQKYSAYGMEIPYVLGGEVILPTKFRERAKETARAKTAKRKEALERLSSVDDDVNKATNNNNTDHDDDEKEKKSGKTGKHGGGSVQTNNSNTDESVKSSKRYRDFLKESLRKVEADMGETLPTIKPKTTSTSNNENTIKDNTNESTNNNEVLTNNNESNTDSNNDNIIESTA